MNSKLKEGQSIAENLNDFKGMITQLSVAGLSLDNETLACLLLGSLPNSWNTLVVSLGNSVPKEKVMLDMVRNSLFNEKIRRKDIVGKTHMPLSRRTTGRRKIRGPFAHNKSRGRSKSRGKIKYYHCGKIGHMERNCKILKQGGDKSHKQKYDKNTIATTSTNDDEVTLLCNQEYCCYVVEQDVEYVVDSAASYHCVPKSEYFSTYKARDYGKVKIGKKSVSQTSMECTRKTWVFLFHTKSRVFQYFHKFHVMVERDGKSSEEPSNR